MKRYKYYIEFSEYCFVFSTKGIYTTTYKRARELKRIYKNLNPTIHKLKYETYK